MRNKVKKLMALSAATGLLAVSVVGVSAATLKDSFNASYYSSTYADLEAAFGEDEDALYNHYLTYGIEEGRDANEYFNVKVYRERYADLDAAFGDDWDAYYTHYLTYGLYEGRSAMASGEVFDWQTYATLNEDLQEVFGNDAGALFQHWIDFGIAEGRTYKVVVETPASYDTGSSSSTTEGTSTGTTSSTTEETSATTESPSDSNSTEDAGTTGDTSTETSTVEINSYQEWVDTMAAALVSDDLETIQAAYDLYTTYLSEIAENSIFDYGDLGWDKRQEEDGTECYLVVASDGTRVGIVVEFTGGDPTIFVGGSRDEYDGFRYLGYGDHAYALERLCYFWLSGTHAGIYNDDGTSYEWDLETDEDVTVWFM